ncbi:flagellar hook-basal body complex protein [Alloiococcus sp. CFN-8]|uniref:flagellar hook-basal body complex protein n=1 Tax=Alloiococcus sp. CFN-8 TaxID=3416081 RepID=UPI003CEA0707
MIRGLYTAVSGLITQQSKQEVVTNNIANVNTIGFKSDKIVAESFKEVLIQNYDGSSRGGKRQELGGLSLGSRIDETITSFTQGTIEDTDNERDFAIIGRGFFTVERDGNRFFSRDGSFNVDNQGFLVSSTGDRVLGVNSSSNEITPIYVGNSNITLSNNNIYIDNNLSYSFFTVDFDSYDNLEKIGDNLYSGDGSFRANCEVKQNALEKSNVNVVNEMLEMMTVMRNFESNQKVVQIIDETLSKAANEVGRI